MTLEFPSGKLATLEWGSAFNWPEHYVIINGTKGSIKIDMQETAGSLRIGGQTKHFWSMKHKKKMMIVGKAI